ncbi:MAG: Type 1 glutamine amidotransferase-like domain-containing protein [Clostridiales bacterium]|nr:Type 1 glutamine amidotransferase-like domain-containing protein [Clostridiales bacterium]
MKIFLTSSPTGPLDGSRPVDGLDPMNRLIENLRADWREKSRCLVIAASPDLGERNDEMAEFFAQALRQAGLDVAGVDVWDSRTEDVSRQSLHTYDVIILGGGHVPTQNAFFERICLRETIRDFTGIVIGVSAGSMNSADTVYAQPELPGEAADPEYHRFLTGLGLTKTMILPHYQMVKDYVLDGMRLFEEITFGDSHGRRFLVLPDGSYLRIINGQETVWGEAYEIADGQIRQICRTDETLRYV